MGKLSEEQILKNKELVEKLIEKFPEGRSNVIRNMFEFIGNEFFLAPASSKEEYHGCFPGGLADHSLRVTNVLLKLAEALAPKKYTREQLIFLGLMHDLGKVGDGELPLYVPNEGPDLAWKRKKGWLYDSNPALPYMPICDRTMYLLNKYGIQVSQEEYIALRISDGPYEKCNEKYSMKEPDLAVLLHMADRWACSLEKSSL